MSSNLDTRVTPSLDPETYRSVEGYSDITRGYVDDVISAFNDIYVTLGKVYDAKELWDRNPATTNEQRILIVGKEAAKQKERVSRRFDNACAALDGRISQVEAELRTPLVQQAALGTLNVEVRSHCKGLNRPDRHKLITEALETDDEATLTAILGGQNFLSGLSRVDHDYYVGLYHARRQPQLVERLALMKRVGDLAGRNSHLIHSAFEKAIGAKPSEVRAINNANDAALAALKIEPAA